MISSRSSINNPSARCFAPLVNNVHRQHALASQSPSSIHSAPLTPTTHSMVLSTHGKSLKLQGPTALGRRNGHLFSQVAGGQTLGTDGAGAQGGRLGALRAFRGVSVGRPGGKRHLMESAVAPDTVTSVEAVTPVASVKGIKAEPVVIVGAGPAGLASALMLARRGWVWRGCVVGMCRAVMVHTCLPHRSCCTGIRTCVYTSGWANRPPRTTSPSGGTLTVPMGTGEGDDPLY